MSFLKKLSWAIGGLVAFLGRTAIAAHYERGMQYATDIHIRFVGGGLIVIIGTILVNFLLMIVGSHGGQTILALLIAPALIYYCAAPAISGPLTAVGASMLAAEPGNQPNAWMVRDGFKGLIRLIGICMFWVEVYIFATIVAPFDLYPTLFWILHILLVIIFALLMGGKISVSDELYRGFWKGAVVLLVVSLFSVMIFRENLGVWWMQHMSNQTGKAIAEKQIEAASMQDKYYAEWVKKNVHTTADGRLVVIVKGKDGKSTVVDAAPYIERAKQKGQKKKAVAASSQAEQCILKWKKEHMGPRKVVHEDEIAAADAECKKEAAANTERADEKKSGKPSYFSYDYWEAKTFEWSEEWGWPIGIVAIIVIATVLLHFIPFVWGLIWGAKKLGGNQTVAQTVVVKKKIVFPFSPIGVLLWALIIWSLISWFNGSPITSSADVSHLGDKISQVFEKTPSTHAPANPVPSYFFDQPEIKTWKAVGSFPDYHRNFGEIAGKSFKIITGTRSGERPSLYDRLEGGWGKPLLIILEENNPTRDIVIEYTENCSIPLTYEDEEVHAICTGKWRSGDRRTDGVSQLIYSPNSRIAKLRTAKPSGEIETITFVFQPK